ncbi:AmpG protein [Alcanivorax hongdengensis A-11-3]|uniref:AmpG protein n=1 Tax=Alcanivorax hongdengensis A-11-3 TaxID=1177179 RepID=L0WB84_9GAMM|nr:MFS transporter [Alcanivorax hongdengensis]EKF74231.1 AmpG protein [Alcanivorax hongdengensis A-11-3]
MKVFRAFIDRPILVIFLLGIASGFPKGMIVSTLSAWLTDEGLSRTSLGLFGLVSLPYAVNFLWAPLVDSFKLGPLGSLLGKRRAWILLTQLLLLGLLFLLGTFDPGKQLFAVALVCVTIAFVSATQDIAIDAIRIESVPVDQQGAAASAGVVGWLLGNLFIAGISLWLTDVLDSWQQIYMVMSFAMLLGIGGTLLAREPQHKAVPAHAPDTPRLRRMELWLERSVLAPFVEFFRRNGAGMALTLLAFIFLFKIGEAFLGSMSIRFYNEIGYEWKEVFAYVKSGGMIALGLGSFLGGAVSIKLGASRGLLLAGIAMALTNLLYAWLAHIGRTDTVVLNIPLLHIQQLALDMPLMTCVILDNFTAGISTIAFVTYISDLCDRQFTATQYALLASLGNLGRTTLASGSGALVDFLGGRWELFFILTAIMAIPGLLILIWLMRRGLRPEGASG